MKAATLESYRPLLRRIINLQGFQFENVFTFRVKGEEIVDALSGKSQFFDIGTKGNKLLMTLFQKWRSTQRPASAILKDHIMSIFSISEDQGGMDFLAMLRERADGELTTKEETLIQLLCIEFGGEGATGEAGEAGGADAKAAEIERIEAKLEEERDGHQKEMRQALLRTRELEESLRGVEENLSSLQHLAEQLQDTVVREQHQRSRADEELKRVTAELKEQGAAAGGIRLSEEQMSMIERERSEMGSQLRDLETELAEARQQLERVQEERSTEQMQYSNELETLMGNVSDLQLRQQELLGQLEESQRERAAMRGQLGDAAREAATHGEERLGELQQEIDQLRSAVAEKERRLDEGLSDRKRLRLDLDARAVEVESIREQVSRKESELDLRHQALAAKEEELNQEKGITASLFQELDQARRERDEMALKAESLEARLSDLTRAAERVEELEEALHLMEGRFQESSDLLGTVMKSRDKYRTVFDSQVNPVFMLDKNLTILHLNRAMLSYTRDHQFQQIIGRRCYEALGLRGICPGCPILKTAETGQLENNLVPMEMEGEVRLFSISAFPTLDADANVTSITEFMEEVTDRVAAVEQLNKVNIERQKIMNRMEANPLAYLRMLLDTMGTRTSGEEVEGEGFRVKG